MSHRSRDRRTRDLERRAKDGDVDARMALMNEQIHTGEIEFPAERPLSPCPGCHDPSPGGGWCFKCDIDWTTPARAASTPLADWGVQCPTCNAAIDSPCVTTKGIRVGAETSTHRRRLRTIESKKD